MPGGDTEHGLILTSLVWGLAASVACGFGALPLLLRSIDLRNRIGLGYGFAGGLMVSASVYNLLSPAFEIGRLSALRIGPVLTTLVGMALGCSFLWWVQRSLTPERLESKFLKSLGGRVGTLVFIAMAFHSIPEGVAVGVGFGSETHLPPESMSRGLGTYVAIAIMIHNIPEGLAVALPMRAAGASIARCFVFAFLTSLPQPLAAVPSSLLVWVFEPLMLPFLGFAAGAMMYLVIVELIPDGLESRTRSEIAWSFMAGFGMMVLVQVGF